MSDAQTNGRIALPEEEAHLWYAWTDVCVNSSRNARYLSVLDRDERLRFDRLGTEHMRHEYLVTRALCRHTLSRYADVTPGSWRFVLNEFGRPRIAEPQAHAGLRYNLSNSRGLVVCLVARDVDVGVDVECARTDIEMQEIANMHFSRAEARVLEKLPQALRERRFFELWTLKECYLKARGTGLALALNQFSFDLDRAPPIRIACDPTLAEVPEAWQFELFNPDDRHVVAAGVHCGTGRRLRLRTFETIP